MNKCEKTEKINIMEHQKKRYTQKKSYTNVKCVTNRLLGILI